MDGMKKFQSFFKDTKPSTAALTVFVASLLVIVLVYKSPGGTHKYIYIWPLTAIQLALILPSWRMPLVRFSSLLAGIPAVMLGGILVGLPFPLTLDIALLTVIDVWICGVILSRGIQGFEDLKHTKNLLLFLSATFAGPIATGAITSITIAAIVHKPYLFVVPSVVFSDSLGIAVVFPVMLFLLTGEYRSFSKLRPILPRGIPAAALFTIATAFVFWQGRYPLLFVVFPPMVLIVFALGLEGAIYVSMTLSIIASYATAHGHGPIPLSRVQTPEGRILLLQAFLWMGVATAFPIGALLDERRRAERSAEDARAIHRILLENAADMIVLSSFDGNHRYISAASERLTGWTPEEYLAMERMSTLHPDDRSVVEMMFESMIAGKQEHAIHYRIAQKAGGYRWVEATARAYFDDLSGDVRGYVGTVRDISGFKNVESILTTEMDKLSRDRQTMKELALTDALTELPNRRAFDAEVREQLRGARIATNVTALLMVDVDYFKLYNDMYGHQAGDNCLRQVAGALRKRSSRASDFVARWGGEEFAILLPETSAAGAQIVADDMLERVRGLMIEHKRSPLGIITISIGISALDPLCIEDPAFWIQQADRALYASKKSGRDRCTLAFSQPETECAEEPLQA